LVRLDHLLKAAIRVGLWVASEKAGVLSQPLKPCQLGFLGVCVD
jgi:hypothetical protein